jgi:hypothetical protein
LIISSINFFIKEDSFNFYPLVTTCVVMIIFYLVSNSDKIESSMILCAESWQQHSLTLRKNNTFQIQIRYDEWSCYYTGNYRVNSIAVKIRINIYISTIYILSFFILGKESAYKSETGGFKFHKKVTTVV